MNKPTEEQADIIETTGRSRDSIMINAYAGCAKTTTLEMLGKKVRGPAIALAFNRSIAEELKGRFADNFEVKTMNGFGYGALMRGRPKVSKWTLDSKKIGKIVSAIAKARKLDLLGEEWEAVRALVNKAQLAGLVPACQGEGLVPDDLEVWQDFAGELMIPQAASRDLIELAREVLEESNLQVEKGIISFDDQIYYPTVFGLAFPQFPTMLVDEAQDLSSLQHAMLRRSLRPDGRLIVCGDPKQAIYAFRGARAESMAEMLFLRSSWESKPLTLTFRCPKIVVERQQRHAPGFRAFETNTEGRFAKWEAEAEGQGETWSFKTLATAKTSPNNSLAVLCRNNGPLLSLAFKLIKSGTGVVMLGRDIGKGLVLLSKKIAPNDEVPVGIFIRKLLEWEETERSTAEVLDRPDRVAGIVDRAECLRAVAEGAGSKTTGDMRVQIEKLFSREAGQVTLSSIHKAKGLEWDIVLHLDPWRVPSKQARKAAREGNGEALRQEWNLRYVAETRTRNVLIEANLADFEGEG